MTKKKKKTVQQILMLTEELGVGEAEGGSKFPRLSHIPSQSVSAANNSSRRSG